MNCLEIKSRWVDVQTSVGVTYQYPGVVTRFMREQYSGPSVYRWFVWAPVRGVSALYVGETDDLVRRTQQYLSPGRLQATNLRLKAIFDEALKRNEWVQLQTLEFEPFQINKLAVSTQSLGDTHIRRMLESFVLAELQASSQAACPVILNQIYVQNAERGQRRTRAVVAGLRKLGMREKADIMEELKRRTVKV